MWDPAQYRLFAAERARPFRELVSRIAVPEPHLVVDLGCGPGELTAELADRWPGARVLGIDNSAEMIDAAREQARPPNLAFELGDVADWQPAGPPDVIVCSAVLQWVPGHFRLAAGWARGLAPGGCLAVQVPGNLDQPAHRLMRELAAAPRWRERLAGVELTRQNDDPARYVEVLATAGCAADVWETTYYQVLPGTDPVLQWYLGTGLRPVLAALGSEDSAAFTAEYGALLRDAYPARPYGTVLPFRRIFAVAHQACPAVRPGQHDPGPQS